MKTLKKNAKQQRMEEMKFPGSGSYDGFRYESEWDRCIPFKEAIERERNRWLNTLKKDMKIPLYGYNREWLTPINDDAGLTICNRLTWHILGMMFLGLAVMYLMTILS